MKKYYGKITVAAIVLLLVFAAIWIAAVLVNPARAATYPARTFLFRGSYTNPYVILFDAANGNVVNYSTGEPGASETWEANDIAASQHAQSDFWTAALPTLDDTRRYILCIGDNASPTETDTVTAFWYSPYTNMATDASMPTTQGRLVTGPY